LALALDGEAMAAVLRRALGRGGESGAAVGGCEIERVKYRPGRSCLVLYRVRMEDGAEQFCYAGLYPAPEAEKRFASALRAAVAMPRYGAPVSLIGEHAMLLWGFPNDRKLAALGLLADGERVGRELLPAVACRRWGEETTVAHCAVTPVSYFPEHAYTVRVDARVLGDGVPRGTWHLYAKTDWENRSAATAAAMQTLWDSPARREGRLVMARPLASPSSHPVLWQEALPGTPLERTVGAEGLSNATAKRVGRCLGALHGIAVDGPAEICPSGILARVHRTADQMAEALPHAAALARQVAGRLAHTFPVAGPVARATLHGDLHLNNILADGERVGFVDLDDLRTGPAAADLGSFIAGLIYRGMLHGQAPSMPEAAVAGFLDGYAEQALSPSWREIRWHVAAALVCERAWRCFTSLKPGRLQLVDELLAAALALAGERPAPSTKSLPL
jgi:Ser/Thr protein kinase RdoA (MazF antagonist)